MCAGGFAVEPMASGHGRGAAADRCLQRYSAGPVRRDLLLQPGVRRRISRSAYSYVATHFLSDSMPLASHVMMHESAPRERAAWEAQAARDWEHFLLLRARELKKGGKMMISTMSRDSSGYSWQEFSHLVWDSIQQVCSRAIARKARSRGAVYPCVFAVRSGDHGAVRVELPGGLCV